MMTDDLCLMSLEELNDPHYVLEGTIPGEKVCGPKGGWSRVSAGGKTRSGR